MSQSEKMILAVGSSPFRVLDFFATDTWEHLGRTSELVAEPHEIATDEGRRLVYVTHTYRGGGYRGGEESGHEISVVDVDTREVVEVIDIHPFIAPHDIEYTAATDLLYASVEQNDAGNGLVIVDPATRRVVGHIPTAAPNSHWLTVTPDGAKAYVTHKEGPMVSVIDLRTRETVRTIEMPGGAEEIDVAPDGSAVWVVTPQQTPPATVGDEPARLIKIDTATDEIVGYVELAPTVVAVRVAPNGMVLVSEMYAGDGAAVVAKMYAGERGDAMGKLHLIDGDTLEVVATVPLDRMSFTIRASSDGREAYVANIGAGTLSVVDLERHVVTRTVDCTPDDKFGGTHGLSLIRARPETL